MTVTEYYNFNLRNVLRKEAAPPPFLLVKALKVAELWLFSPLVLSVQMLAARFEVERIRLEVVRRVRARLHGLSVVPANSRLGLSALGAVRVYFAF